MKLAKTYPDPDRLVEQFDTINDALVAVGGKEKIAKPVDETDPPPPSAKEKAATKERRNFDRQVNNLRKTTIRFTSDSDDFRYIFEKQAEMLSFTYSALNQAKEGKLPKMMPAELKAASDNLYALLEVCAANAQFQDDMSRKIQSGGKRMMIYGQTNGA